METLSQLPEVPTKKTKIEEEIMQDLFPSSEESPPAPSKQTSSNFSWRTVFAASIGFCIAGNPWISPLICKIPGGANPLLEMAIRLLLFLGIFLGYLFYSTKTKS